MSRVKASKAITFTAQAVEHHTSVKIKSVLKWIKEGREVRVSITGKEDRQKAMEAIYKNLEKDIKSDAKFTQKHVKPQSINVVLRPTALAPPSGEET